MFLGTFNYEKLRGDGLIAYALPFMYTYMLLFKFMMINMFFAIVDKNFRAEHDEFEMTEKQRRDKARGEAARIQKNLGSNVVAPSRESSFIQRTMQGMKKMSSF